MAHIGTADVANMHEDRADTRTGKVVKLAVIALCVLTVVASDVHADLVWTCPVCKYSFHFPSNASAYRNSFAQRHLSVCRDSASAGGPSYSSGTGDPVFDAMMPMLDSLFQQLGKSMADELFGDPQQQRRQAELYQIEQQRLQELENERRIEMARIRKQLHEKLLSELMLLGTTEDLPLMTLSDDVGSGLSGATKEKAGGEIGLMGMDDGLRPAGTSFFGLGGGDGNVPPGNDTGNVDMQNLRRAAYLVQKAEGAAATDAELLIDEGLRIASGQPAFVAIDDRAVPLVSERGLLAFQGANNNYRRACDLHLETSARYAKDNAQYDKARALYEKAKQELDKTSRSKSGDLAAQQETMDKLRRRLRQLYENRMETKAGLEPAENDTLWSEARRRSALKDIIVPQPSVIADILEKERKNLNPSILDRLHHTHDKNIAEEYSREFDRDVEENYGFVADPALSERIERLTQRVRALSPYPDEPSSVRIIARPRDREKASGLEKGVWSTSDTIYFGIEYLEEGHSDDEIMFVAGHEIAHVQRGHYAEQLKAREDVSEAANPDELIDWDNSPLSEKQKLKIHEAVYRGALHDLNHQQELDADRLGAFMALSAGAKPGAFRAALGSKPPIASRNLPPAEKQLRELTATHPDGPVRIEKLRQIYSDVIDKAPTVKN